VAHLLANGMLADVLLFGGFLVWAVADRISLKRRPASTAPDGLSRPVLAATTPDRPLAPLPLVAAAPAERPQATTAPDRPLALRPGAERAAEAGPASTGVSPSVLGLAVAVRAPFDSAELPTIDTSSPGDSATDPALGAAEAVTHQTRAVDLAGLRGAVGGGLLDAIKIGRGKIAVGAGEFGRRERGPLLRVEKRGLRIERANRLLGHRDLLEEVASVERNERVALRHARAGGEAR
jgi:hypothetical protein